MEFFPQAFPDETIYSLAARYHRLAANASYRQTSYDLFGRYSRTCGSAFPCCLDALSQQLANKLSVSYLIQAHTLLPIFAPFLSSSQLDTAIKAMSGPSGIGLKMSVGLTASGFERFGALKFCERCVARDIRHGGQAYWHRIHQVTGVLVCPYHQIVLKVASPPFDDWRYLFLPDGLKDRGFEDAVQNQNEIPALTEVAQLTAWGFRNSAEVSKLLTGGLLRYRLAELGILHRDRIRLSLLHDYLNGAMAGAPQSREYQLLNAGEPKGHEWVLRLLRTPRRSHHPFRFYFLCHLLGLDSERLSNLAFAFEDQGLSTFVRENKIPYQKRNVPGELKVNAHRERFVAYPESTRVHDRTDYMWLYRNDRIWLTDYVRSHHMAAIRYPYVDWAARDAELVVELQKASDCLLQSHSWPIRISYAALARAVPRHYDFLRLATKFPCAIETVRDLVETEHDFQLRKIAWVFATYPQAKEMSTSNLLRLAAIRIRRVSDTELSMLLQGSLEDSRQA
ncbi:hypothetical protein B0D71_18205 [Pseudomonas laurylsulfativorans]|uniref:Uncharacterized protein n=2 Tax=Pseudomonas TaxID=286 RepID=A0A2S3VMI7_9PSED|nr:MULTISPECIES: TniQ family protein [Pseudomonas]POF41166.1 hypothetical protein B0D71_18205 [Pseudomonas laurylsulfativorans]PPK37319.1 hypothetical protein CD175_21040 [Pseudomonas laurylsulfatiphila]